MTRRLREMRDWPWTERAHTVAGTALLLFPLLAAAFLEGYFR